MIAMLIPHAIRQTQLVDAGAMRRHVLPAGATGAERAVRRGLRESPAGARFRGGEGEATAHDLKRVIDR
jgi:hypothetical protein